MDPELENVRSQKQLREIQKRHRLSQEFIFIKKEENKENVPSFSHFLADKKNISKKVQTKKTRRTGLRDITNSFSRNSPIENDLDITPVPNYDNSICKSLDFWFKQEEIKHNKFPTETTCNQNLQKSQVDLLELDLTLKSSVKIVTATDLRFLGRHSLFSEQKAISKLFLNSNLMANSTRKEASAKENLSDAFSSAAIYWEFKSAPPLQMACSNKLSESLTQSLSFQFDDSIHEKKSPEDCFRLKWEDWQNAFRSVYFGFRNSRGDFSFYLSGADRTIVFTKTGNGMAATTNLNYFLRNSFAEEKIAYVSLRSAEKVQTSDLMPLTELNLFEKEGGQIKRSNAVSERGGDYSGELRDTVMVSGRKHVHSLFDLILNSPRNLFSDPPLILSEAPFKGASLRFLKGKTCEFRGESGGRMFSLELNQICLPSLITRVAKVLKEFVGQEKLVLKAKPVASSKGVNFSLLARGTFSSKKMAEIWPEVGRIESDFDDEIFLDVIARNKALTNFLTSGMVKTKQKD